MVSTKHLNNDLCKLIGFIISAVIYGKKGYRLWSDTTIKKLGNMECQIDRYICGKTYLINVNFPLYNFHYFLF